jgi:hypothetical protein
MRTITIFLSFLVVLLLVNPVSGSDWRPLGTRNGNIVSLDKKSVKHTANNVVRYWMKLTLCDDSKREILHSRLEDGLSNEGWNKLSYGVSVNEINCQARQTRGELLSLYDADGNQLYHQEISGDWSLIEPDTGPDLIQKLVCEK